MRVLVSGSTGFLGSRTVEALSAAGHQVVRLVRPSGAATGAAVRWDPYNDCIDRAAAASADAIVHLAGESIAGRWTDAKRREIRRSRAVTTRFLAEVAASLPGGPRTLVSASAVGIYGDRGDEVVSEDSPAGEGFLASVCREWEDATLPAREAGLRVVNLRFGVVLDPAGGSLKLMLPAFRLGLGGRLGDGRQYVSWITRDDAAAVLTLALTDDSISGPINVVSPNPVTNAEFTRALARAVHRPAPFAVPRVALRLAVGGMADEALLSSQRVNPKRLKQLEYRFGDPLIDGALQRILA